MTRSKSKSQKIKASSRLYQKVKRSVLKELKSNKLELTPEQEKALIHETYLSYKGQNFRKVKVKDIRKTAFDLEFGDKEVKAERYFNPLQLDIASLTGIPWWEIDDFLTTDFAAMVTPLNIRFECNAGDQYGTTGMLSLYMPNGGFKYEYFSSGLNQIVENLRMDIENKSGPEWVGSVVIRKGKQDDGKASSYFIQFTLVDTNGEPIPPTQTFEESEIELPQPSPEIRKERRKDVIERQKELEKRRKEELSKKEKRKRKRPEVKVKVGKQPPAPPVPPPAPKPGKISGSERAANIQAIMDRQEKQLDRLERLLRDKIISKKDYLAQSNALIEQTNLAISKFEKGGEI